MTGTTPEPADASSSFCTTPAEGRLAPYICSYVQQALVQAGFSVESSFEPETLWVEAEILPLGNHGLHENPRGLNKEGGKESWILVKISSSNFLTV
ncbi:hypothetical protein AVEN_197336-1 [Araneus ventricosus]|uniref:Uncharacterized protein n=1 Tax=Araneus ventricosus TaxID=182803 RepID=A0A4Y2IU79_ARAVE|nr:hypothetical protein AVEN_197336-1 [Araneus ventricosus]